MPPPPVLPLLLLPSAWHLIWTLPTISNPTQPTPPPTRNPSPTGKHWPSTQPGGRVTKMEESSCIEESVQKILLFVDNFGQINVTMRDSATGSPLTLSY